MARLGWLLLTAGGLASLLACLARLVGVCRLVSLAGGEAAYMLLGVLVYALVDGLLGVEIVSGLALAASAAVFLKVYLNLPRPPMSLWLAEAHGPGFPSGHATTASAFWTLVALHAGSPVAALAGALYAGAVSLSRLVLHVHYPRDVAGGLVLGLASALAAHAAARRLGRLRAAALLGLASLPMAALALSRSPGYASAARLAGIDAGLAAAALLLGRARWAPGALSSGSRRLRLLSLLASLAAMAVAAVLDGLGLAARVAGFALFAGLVAASRPLAALVLRLRGRGS